MYKCMWANARTGSTCTHVCGPMPGLVIELLCAITLCVRYDWLTFQSYHVYCWSFEHSCMSEWYWGVYLCVIPCVIGVYIYVVCIYGVYVCGVYLFGVYLCGVYLWCISKWCVSMVCVYL